MTALDLYDADTPSFSVNKDFAAKFELKKRTEELSKLQDKYGADYTLEDEEDEEEDLSDDDSDAELVTPQVDVAILRTLARIRQKDPLVYEENRSVFQEEEIRTTGAPAPSAPSRKPTATKPVLLKDFQRARLIADPTDSLPDPSNSFKPTFADEERQLKRETTQAFHLGADENDAEEEDEEEDLLQPRAKTKDEREKEDEEYNKFIKANAGDRAVEDALEQEEQFLRDYILNRGWIDRSGKTSRIPSYNEITGSPPPSAAASGSNAALPKIKKVKKDKSVVVPVDSKPNDAAEDEGEEEDESTRDPGQNDDEDEEYEERADDFENAYNFRFEEAAGPTLTTHSRTSAALTVRKPTDAVSARARARDAAKTKKEEDRAERREEVRRLKALKRQEVEAKLLKLVEAAGEGAVGLEEMDLEGDWDPDAHDAMMKKVYGEDYDGVADAEFQPEIEGDDGAKPTWDDDIDISDLHQSMPDKDDDDSSSKPIKKEKKSKRKRDEEGFPLELLEAAKKGGDEARAQLLEQMVDDYYKLDYEDKIGDLPTRFHYAKVAPSSFNLTPSEILLATDTELNAYISLRKMAPYRPEDAAKKGKSKKRLKELRDGLKERKWGVEVDEGVEGENSRKKVKWSEENGRRKEGEGGAEVGGLAVKRVGKKERERRKKAAALLEGQSVTVGEE